MENLESKYIIQNIFSFMNVKKKFKLVKYNKSLKNKLDINLEDYKKLSGRYIIYSEKGKGKEYISTLLLFEREYINGERKKGKEYDWNGNVLFEGEYINGKRNGIVKEYDWKGNVLFEGEYINGERKKGKQYNFNNELIFDGKYKNEQMWKGKGKEYNKNNILMIN